MGEQGWDLVAARFERELAVRGSSLRAIEVAAGVNFRTLQKLLSGEGVASRKSLARVAEHFGWRGDAFDLIRRGEEPVLLEPSSSPEDWRFRALERRVDRLEALLEDALQPEDQPPAE